MKGKVLFLIGIAAIYTGASAWAQAPLDFPEKPLGLIAETAGESCSVCTRQKLKEAFQLLEEQFRSGRILKTTETCRLVRNASIEANELALSCDLPGKESLPLLTFRFHTSADHLVGISPADFTEESIASEYLSAGSETVFEGILKTIAFRYGDGTTFSYSATRQAIQVHCRLLTLKRRSP